MLKYLYPQGRPKALTMSYDDGVTQDRRLVAIFNRYGIRGTFHLNSALLGTGNRIQPEEVADLYAGHEVSCHSARTTPISNGSPPLRCSPKCSTTAGNSRSSPGCRSSA